VSTILDALRRLQRERQQDLRDSVLGEEPVLPPEPRRGRALLLFGVLLLVSVGVGWFVWPGQERLRAALDFSNEGAATATVKTPAPPAEMPTQVAKLEKARRELEERRRAARAVQVQKQSERAKAQQQAAAPPAPAGTRPGARPSSAVPNPTQTAKTESVNRPPAPTPPAPAQAAASPTPFLNAPAQETPAPSARPPQRATAQARAPAAQARAQAPTKPTLPELDLAFRLEPVPRAPVDPDADPDFGAVSADGFPRLTVEQVRWHPAPERRVARILLEDTRPVEAYEGDIIAGVAIHRIDPGAVELRLGDASRRIAIGQ